MRQKYDEGYLELLAKVREKKPKYYGVLLSTKYPNIESGRVYNIMQNGVQDWDALKALADVLGLVVSEVLNQETTD